MKRINTRNLGLALTIGLSILATDVVFAQGKGNSKKEEQEKTEQEKGRLEEARERRHKPSSIKDIVENEKEEARARGAQKGDKGNKHADKDHNNTGKENNGNAYGKNKGELSGREFGQARAAQAQLTAEERKENLEKVAEDGDKKVRDSREKIARAKEALEKDKKDKKITDAVYNEKKARIERAERAVQVLEEKVNAAKVLVTVQ